VQGLCGLQLRSQIGIQIVSGVGEYSIRSAILRMDTFSYPSSTNNSRAASSIS
jgi:hypothetical protein